MKRNRILLLSLLSFVFVCCTQKTGTGNPEISVSADSVLTDQLIYKEVTPDDIIIEKQLLYDQHTLDDTYPYQDTVREFQWDKIKERLAMLENIQSEPVTWGVLQNYKNRNGEAALVRDFKRNAYKRVSDKYGVERYQSVPLYLLSDTVEAERYGRDGSPVKLKDSIDGFWKIETVNFDGEWLVPKRYIKIIGDTIAFNKTVFVDRTNQNISTLEKTEGKWLVRSMNPTTTGLHRPPYQQETPRGFFLVQEKKPKMIFLKDGSADHGGYAPYASRFTNGGYLHGVPVNAPATAMIEYSWTLGTTPRSHMCVRNATSHAKFIYDWEDMLETVVFVFD